MAICSATSAHAEANEIGGLDAKRPQERRGVICHLLVGQRPVKVSGVAMALQFYGDDLARRREGWQETRKTAIDRSHRTVKKNQWRTAAVDLVVHVEPVHEK
jgi:hypothetical protein